MEYTIIERVPEAFQQPVTREQIIAMCERAFGEGIQIESVKELGGGLYNNVYLVRIAGMQQVILRVGPHSTRMSSHESDLMRNEHYSQPFLAPIATLIPKTIMVDFTHQILERDYLFQTFMEGEQWAQIAQELTPEEKIILYRQLGGITKQIHSVKGKTFGSLSPDSQFSLWSLAVIDLLTKIIRDIEDVQLDATDMRRVLDIAQANTVFLDEITEPHLLHGDLWTVNILVKRSEEGPKIVAVLDSDRTSWGDPMADWTIFLLHRNAHTEADAFWQTYGQPEGGVGAQFRRLVYQARYLGGARLEHHHHVHKEAVKRSYKDMQTIIYELKDIIAGSSSDEMMR